MGAEQARKHSSVEGGRAVSPWSGEQLRAMLDSVPDESPREQLRRLTRAMVRAMPVPESNRRKRGRP